HNWPAVLKLLDEPSAEPFRAVARRAVADQYIPAVVDGLIERLHREADAGRRRGYADLLTRVYKKPDPAAPSWGFRAAPRPGNTVAWERSDAVEQALDGVVADLAVLRRMLREKVPARAATLGRRLAEERDADAVAALLGAFRGRPGGEARP